MVPVSVIVPIFNAHLTIQECLRSLLCQSLEGIEIVLVDDHGQDDSIELAKKTASEYEGSKRFQFTQTPSNSGPGAARNIGIAAATGEYVAFVDADDTVSPDFCRKLYEAAKTADADLACCDIAVGEKIHHNPDVSNKRRFLTRFVSFFTTFIYRRMLLTENGITFPGTRSAEDTCFLTCSLLAARRIAQVHEVMYYYRDNPSSVTRRPDPDRAKQRLASFRYLLSYAREHGFWHTYRLELLFIVLKKGYALALKDRILYDSITKTPDKMPQIFNRV